MASALPLHLFTGKSLRQGVLPWSAILARQGTLAAILVLALLLRTWSLATVPPGLDSDEAAFAYNAYSLLRTGRDEYGVVLPASFRSFGEYKRPAFAYFSVPFVAVFGPTPLGARLPGAVAGTLSVAAMYATATPLLRSRRLGLIAAGMLAISPWHLQFSRGAREVSLELLFVLCFTAAFLRAVHRPGSAAGWWCIASALSLAGALYSYPGALACAPLLLAAFAWCYWPRVRLLPRRWVAVALLLLGLLAAPLGLQLLDGSGRARPAAVSLLSDRQALALSQARMARDAAIGGVWIFQTPPFLLGRVAIGAYLSHFNPTFLFTEGDGIARHRAADHGLLYLWDLPLVLAGGLMLARHTRRPAMRAVAAWLLIGPLPAVLATPAPHAVRSLVMLPAWYLLAATGVRTIWGWLGRRRLQFDWLLLLAASVTFYVMMYYVDSPVEQAMAWQSGWLQGFATAKQEVDRGRYTRVVIDSDLEVGYIFALVGTQYDPRHYLDQGGTRIAEDWPSYPEPGPLTFEPFEVRAVNWADVPRGDGTLYVVNGSNTLPAGARSVAEIRNIAGQAALRLVDFPA